MNGLDATDRERLIQAQGQALASMRLVFDIERRGAPMTIIYDLR
jgi:hypothetical protein